MRCAFSIRGIRWAMGVECALCEAGDAGEDRVSGLGPREGLRRLVRGVYEILDGSLELPRLRRWTSRTAAFLYQVVSAKILGVPAQDGRELRDGRGLETATISLAV